MMESFTITIDNKLKANLYKICRLCGIDHSDMIPVVSSIASNQIQDPSSNNEPDLSDKIEQLLGLLITKDDQMPQDICTLCCDKINEFHDFREMCYTTDIKTRKLLGLKGTISEMMTDITKSIHKDEKSKSIKELQEPANDNGITINTIINRKRRLNGSEQDFINISIQSSQNENFDIDNKKVCTSSMSNKPDSRRCRRKIKRANHLIQRGDLLYYNVENIIRKKNNKLEGNKSLMSTTSRDTCTCLKLKTICKICRENFGEKTKLPVHIRTCHLPNVERYICTACDQIFYKGFDIRNHQLWHKLSKTPYECGLCGKLILTTYSYNRHLRDHNATITLISSSILISYNLCPKCHVLFATNFLFNTHFCAIQSKHCCGCNEKFQTNNDFILHAAKCEKVYSVYNKNIKAKSALTNKTAFEESSLIKEEYRMKIKSRQTNEDCSGKQFCEKDDKHLHYSRHTYNRFSRKGLKRIDKLLKSTLDALIKMKHGSELYLQSFKNSDGKSLNYKKQKHKHYANNCKEFNSNDHDDHDNDVYDDVIREEELLENIDDERSVLLNSSILKEEILSDEENETFIRSSKGDKNYLPLKMPTLKFKICKEDGQLYSSLLDKNNYFTMLANRSDECKNRRKNKDFNKNDEEKLLNLEVNKEFLIAETNADQCTITSFNNKSIIETYLDAASVQPHSFDSNAIIMTSIPMKHLEKLHQTIAENKGELENEITYGVDNCDEIKLELLEHISSTDINANAKEIIEMNEEFIINTEQCRGNYENGEESLKHLQISMVQDGVELPQEIKTEPEELFDFPKDKKNVKHSFVISETEPQEDVEVKRIIKQQPDGNESIDSTEKKNLNSTITDLKQEVDNDIQQTKLEPIAYSECDESNSGLEIKWKMNKTEKSLKIIENLSDETNLHKSKLDYSDDSTLVISSYDHSVETSSGFIVLEKEALLETRPFSTNDYNEDEELEDTQNQVGQQQQQQQPCIETEHSLEEEQNQLNHMVQEQQEQQQQQQDQSVVLTVNEENCGACGYSQLQEENENIKNESQNNSNENEILLPIANSSQTTDPYFELDNINEIAENNNNANIEKELLDEGRSFPRVPMDDLP